MADEIHNTLDSYQSDISSSKDSFCLQVKNPTKTRWCTGSSKAYTLNYEHCLPVKNNITPETNILGQG